MKEIIKLDFDEVKLVEEADGIVLNRGQEKMLVQLLQAKENIDRALEMIKEAIGRAGEKIDPSFKGLKNDKFSFMYRVYGSKYRVDEEVGEDNIASYLLEKRVSYRLKSQDVDQYVEEFGELPYGVVERDRSKKASLKLNVEEIKS